MDIKLGMEAKLYFCAAGIAGTPTWTELANVKNLTLSLQKGEADGTTRANNGWKATIGTLKEGSIEFEMVWKPSDAGFAAMKTSFFTNSAIGIACMDGPIATAGSEGLWADMEVMNFSREEPLDGPISVKVAIKPTYSANAPQWKTIAAA